MIMTERRITVAELVKGYKDDGDGGVVGFDGRLTIRPAYQREFVYKDKQRNAVIESIREQLPISVMYWSKTGEDTYELIDGQQRTLSICQYVNSKFSININGNNKYFHNLTETEKKQIEDYKLIIFVCEGTEEEKLKWFKKINVAGVVLTQQELLNATYTGAWLADAKEHFSKRGSTAYKAGEGYIKGNVIRQEYFEKVLKWIADRDNLSSGEGYMAIHQRDEDANELWTYYLSVIDWAKRMFPTVRKGITDAQEWGLLYNKYHNKQYNTNTLETEIKKLIEDDDVTKDSGIIPYVLSDKTKHDEKHLSIRAFSESQKRRAYERQGHKCPCCVRNGVNTEYAFEDMQGDHIIPWSQGGRTVDDNLQMLCQKCNNDKGGK